MHYNEMRNSLMVYVKEYGESIGIRDIINALNGILFDLYAASLDQETKKKEDKLSGHRG